LVRIAKRTLIFVPWHYLYWSTRTLYKLLFRNMENILLLPTPHLQSQIRRSVLTIKSRLEARHSKSISSLALVRSKWDIPPWLVGLWTAPLRV
jgi:hypothetical protein